MAGEFPKGSNKSRTRSCKSSKALSIPHCIALNVAAGCDRSGLLPKTIAVQSTMNSLPPAANNSPPKFNPGAYSPARSQASSTWLEASISASTQRELAAKNNPSEESIQIESTNNERTSKAPPRVAAEHANAPGYSPRTSLEPAHARSARTRRTHALSAPVHLPGIDGQCLDHRSVSVPKRFEEAGLAFAKLGLTLPLQKKYDEAVARLHQAEALDPASALTVDTWISQISANTPHQPAK